MYLGTSASWLEWRMERGESVDTMFNYSPPKHPISACRRTALHCGNCLSKRQRGGGTEPFWVLLSRIIKDTDVDMWTPEPRCLRSRSQDTHTMHSCCNGIAHNGCPGSQPSRIFPSKQQHKLHRSRRIPPPFLWKRCIKRCVCLDHFY